MKIHISLVCNFLAILVIFPASLAAERPPNVVPFFVDDLGQRDLGCYGSTFYETSNIDCLAQDGAKFTDACVVCSPTRVSILTVNWPPRTGITADIGAPLTPEQWKRNTKLLPAPYANRLALDSPTLAKSMKASGYRTFSPASGTSPAGVVAGKPKLRHQRGRSCRRWALRRKEIFLAI